MFKTRSGFVAIALVLLFTSVSLVNAGAQTLQLSKNADFTTTDGVFSFSDHLYAKVTASQINFLTIKKNEYELKPRSSADGTGAKGAFTNNLDGTYTVDLDLSGLSHSQREWEFRAEIRDDGSGRFETRLNLKIQEVAGAGDTVQVTARIESLGSDYLEISSKKYHIDTATAITGIDGLPLDFSALQKHWTVAVTAEMRSDNLLWAISIQVISEFSQGQKIETKGLIAAINNDIVTINNIHFVVQSSTEILDKNDEDITLSELAIGMNVEAKGTQLANGDVLADRIKIDDDSTSGGDLELTGHIDSIDSTSTPRTITVDGTQFEVDAGTEILGFRNEMLHLTDLHVGELVEVKALTRGSDLPLAVRVKREDKNGDDLEFKGTILSIVDSSVTVGQLTFQIVPTTILLDHKKNFITLADLHSGLPVEVHANQAADGSYIASRIKVENDDKHEVEIKGFIEALTDTSVTLAGFTFLVDGSTLIHGDDGGGLSIDALEIGMLVEVKGSTMLDGTYLAADIEIEEFLKDEIKLKGAIESLGSDSLVVSGQTFFTMATTQVMGKDGLMLDFSQLAVGMIVEVKAKRQNGVWMATKIKVKDKIDGFVEIKGTVDSLRTASFFVRAKEVNVNANTEFLDRNKQVIQFADLQAGDDVEVKAQLLPDGSLLAFRVKLEDNALGSGKLEFTGAITAIDSSEIAAGGFTLAVDAGTRILDHDKQPLTLADLKEGMVVEVKATIQADGSLLATEIKVEDRHSLSGVVSQVNVSSITVQGFTHSFTVNSILLNDQNQPIAVTDLRADQQVQLVARRVNTISEVVTLRVTFSGTITAVPGLPQYAPTDYTLLQNYPNPFNPSTVIRFSLPQATQIQLTVYNILGRKVRTLLEGVRTAGEHQIIWNGRDDAGRNVATGIYFYRLNADGITLTRRLTLMR